MQFGVWAFIGLLALVLQLYWMSFEKRIPVTTLPSGFLWFVWGFYAINVETGTVEVISQSYPSLRYFGYFLGVMNISLLALWLWQDEDEDLFGSEW